MYYYHAIELFITCDYIWWWRLDLGFGSDEFKVFHLFWSGGQKTHWRSCFPWMIYVLNGFQIIWKLKTRNFQFALWSLLVVGWNMYLFWGWVTTFMAAPSTKFRCMDNSNVITSSGSSHCGRASIMNTTCGMIKNIGHFITNHLFVL